MLSGHGRWITGVAVGLCKPSALPPPAPPPSTTPEAAEEKTGEAVPAVVSGKATSTTTDPRLFLVSSAADGTLKVWRLSDGSECGTLRGHDRGITDLQLRGTRLVTGSMDKTIRAWELAPLLSRPTHAPPVAAPAAAADEETPLPHALPRTCELLCATEHTDFVRCVAFDHQRLISCGDDGKVCVMYFGGGSYD